MHFIIPHARIARTMSWHVASGSWHVSRGTSEGCRVLAGAFVSSESVEPRREGVRGVQAAPGDQGKTWPATESPARSSGTALDWSRTSAQVVVVRAAAAGRAAAARRAAGVARLEQRAAGRATRVLCMVVAILY